ncbi:hypothetical protein Swit_1524 [Rhizorhabdus wittichii RW1]|uniref:DUF3489 domain-containing protein n=1 Tax=Rhizorhabdus wittichii (strain DSM 6014 / CCUG 31198 / JCM 15750 / NBRC 105917 / EY 4224 / RW1) TaxID=392499 RepID=A0A9J9HAG0_RHIWR|nr:hypothetical protein Swit_1524 [Rhizorhabdus wittichii RW1]
MTKLTDMQLVLLSTACQREDGSLLPPPDSLGAQAARIRKAVEALIKKGLAAEQEGMAVPQAWRTDGDLVIGVIVTDAGRSIIEPPVAEETPAGETDETPVVPAPAAGRTGTKQALVIDLLKRKGGATLTDIIGTTGWLPHTSRAALTGLRKKGHAISSEKVEGVTRYYIATAA